MKDLSLEKKTAIVVKAQSLFVKGTNRLMDGSLKILTTMFKPVGKTSIKRILAGYHNQEKAGNKTPSLASKRVGKCGRNSKLTEQLRKTYADIGNTYARLWIRLSMRMLQEDLKKQNIHLSTSTIWTHLKLMHSKKKNIRIKPILSPAQRKARIQWIIDRIDTSHGVERSKLYYLDLLSWVCLDESWFYMQRVNNEVLIFEGVDIPFPPTTRHKSHIEKVMFLVALARPQKRPDGSWFDGKIGLWSCTEAQAAKRNSVKRPKGTMITNNKSMDSAFYLDIFEREGGLLDCMKEKMPFIDQNTFRIQQDGAGPHTGKDSPAKIEAAALLKGMKVQVMTQPSNSPDLNILDLGFFHSLKSRVSKLKNGVKTADDLIGNVKQAFNEYNRESLDHIWAHQFRVWNSILQVDGGNYYPAPHGHGRAKEKKNGSAVDLEVDKVSYISAKKIL